MRRLFYLSWLLYFSMSIIETHGKIPNKMIGGEPVRISQYNHQVSVQIKNTHICGGSIIGMRHILTTASCISSEISDDIHATYGGIQILSGTADLLRDGPSDSRMINDVSYIIHHKGYNARNFFVNDIAILKLAESLVFNTVRGSMKFSVSPGNRCPSRITAWGENVHGQLQKNLQYLETLSLGVRICKSYYKFHHRLARTQACVEPQSKWARLTRGNSGSAVMRKVKIAGVLSVINTNPRIPAIYTNTAIYYDWLKKTIAAA